MHCKIDYTSVNCYSNYVCAVIKYIQKQWELFKAKSLLGKASDILIVVLLIGAFTPDGRVWMQRAILSTGLMSSIESNENRALVSDEAQWMLQDLEGNTISFGQETDKPIFLNFWATWCPPCKAEMPSIIELNELMGDKLQMYLVTNEDPEKVRAFLEKKNWDLPVYFPLTAVPVQLKAEALPSTYIIDRENTLVHQSVGMTNWSSSEVQDFISKL